MRRILLTFLVMILSASFCMADDSTEVKLLFGGVRHDDVGLHVSTGVGCCLTGGLWTLNYVDAGGQSSFSTELAYLCRPFGALPKLTLGMVAGPNTVWQPGDHPIAYLVGATGGIVAYDMNNKYGLWSYAKYRFEVENKGFLEDWLFGVGLYYRF